MAEIDRGAVVFVGRAIKGARRMAVVVQSDAFTSLPSVLICPITMEPVDAPFLRVRLEPSDTLPLPSIGWAMAELLTAVPRAMIGAVIGHISVEQQRALDRALIVIAGIA